MRLLSSPHEDRCLPIRIVSEQDDYADGLIGGSPPDIEGIPTGLRYFATIPFAEDPDMYVSLFVAENEILSRARGRLNELGLVQVVVHGPRPRRTYGVPNSPLSAHRLVLLPETEDWLVEAEGERIVRSGHKLGGRPHLIRNTPALQADISSVRSLGFTYVLQIDFPGHEDVAVAGPWPFGDGIFGLFGRPPFEHADWRWWWDF